MLGVIVLARLLVPEDFGLVAMVVAIAGLGDVVRELGLGIAAIQARDLTVGQRDNLFWANTFLGCLIGVIFFGLSHLIADFYGDPRLVAITQCLAITFVFNGMAAQYRAGLQRDLKFVGVVAADVLSMAFGVVIAIVLSLRGFGYWSIVMQQVAQPVIGLLIVVVAARWLPGRIRRGQGTRSLLAVGWNVFVYHIFIYVSRNIDTVLVGARYGAVPAGYYNRAFSLMTVPLAQFLTPSTRIAVSVLSKLQDDPKQFLRYLQRAQDALNFACLGILAVLFGEADAVVALLLGPQWHEVVPIFQILAIAGMFQVFAYPPVWALLALGHSRANLLQTIVARCVLIAAVVIGAFFSVEGVAIGYACGMAAVWPISIICLARVSPLQVGGLLSSAFRHVAVFGAAAAILVFTDNLLGVLPPIVHILVGVATMAAVICCVVIIWPAFRRDAVSVYRAFSRVRSTKGLSV